jgi:hypothetical protein
MHSTSSRTTVGGAPGSPNANAASAATTRPSASAVAVLCSECWAASPNRSVAVSSAPAALRARAAAWVSASKRRRSINVRESARGAWRATAHAHEAHPEMGNPVALFRALSLFSVYVTSLFDHAPS